MLFFTWIIFVELNFTVLFLLLRNDRFAGKVAEWVTSINGGILAMGAGGGGGGVETPLRTMHHF